MPEGLDSPLSRRAFLRAGVALEGRPEAAVRPPWTSNESVRSRCTSCGDCVTACPEKIIRLDRESQPYLDFPAGGCTFCAACLESCKEGVFNRHQSPPLSYKAKVSRHCLNERGISCQLCRDICEAEAIRFDYTGGPVGSIKIETELCSGCGACLHACPSQALSLHPDEAQCND